MRFFTNILCPVVAITPTTPMLDKCECSCPADCPLRLSVRHTASFTPLAHSSSVCCRCTKDRTERRGGVHRFCVFKFKLSGFAHTNIKENICFFLSKRITVIAVCVAAWILFCVHVDRHSPGIVGAKN